MPTVIPTPTRTASPVELLQEEAGALLHENAARAHDEIIRNMEHCRFTYAYAGLPGKHGTEDGWVVEKRMAMRDGRLTYKGGSASNSPKGDDAARIPEGYDSGIELFDLDYDPVEWFGAEYRSLVDNALSGTYAGRSAYLGQPSLRYETRVAHEGEQDPNMPASVLIVTDYLIENPYVFVENEYSVSANGVRRLERQFMRYRFELTHCTASEKRDAAAVAVWQELAEKAAEAYKPIRDGLLGGCHMTSSRNGVWVPPGGSPFPGGPADFEEHYVIARDIEGSWRVTSELVMRQMESIIYGRRTTLDGTWLLNTQTGEWREEPFADNPAYEDLSEFLPDYISAIGYPRLVDVEGSPVPSDHGQYYDYRYTGKTVIDGRVAARYEQISAYAQVLDADYGMKIQVEAYEFFEDNPLLSRRSSYYLLPDGELQSAVEATDGELELQNCPD